jgi:hypothetical protein
VSERRGDEIALDDCGLRTGRSQLVGDGASEDSADAGFTADAAVDLEDGHLYVLGIDLLPGHFK